MTKVSPRSAAPLPPAMRKGCSGAAIGRTPNCGTACALAASHAERLLWGSDWPHTELWDGMHDDADLIETIRAAIDDPTIAEKIFVRNAEALFFGR